MTETCQHRHGVGGACLMCGFKHPDHDELVTRLRALFLEMHMGYAIDSDSPFALDECAEIERGERLKLGFGIPYQFDFAFDQVVGDNSRKWEFVIEFFRVYVNPSREDKDVLAFAIDYIAYTLELDARTALRNFPESQQKTLDLAQTLRRGERIARSIMAYDALCAALQTVFRGGSADRTETFAEKLFLPE